MEEDASLMAAAGHRLVTPTYTGLGERAHLANPSIDLETHIQDILNVIQYEDLRDIVLVGHSYGGMVATGVADRVRDRISRLIYIDAFVPEDGQSLFDLNEADRQRMTDLAKSGDGWRVPPHPTRRIRRRRPTVPLADRAPGTHPIRCSRQDSRRTAARHPAAQLYLRDARQPWDTLAVCRARQERPPGAATRSTPAIRRTSPRRRRSDVASAIAAERA